MSNPVDEAVVQMFVTKTMLSVTVDVSTSRFVGAYTTIHGIMDELPTEHTVKIEGKEYYYNGEIEPYSQEKQDFNEMFGEIFFQELQSQINREVIEELLSQGKL